MKNTDNSQVRMASLCVTPLETLVNLVLFLADCIKHDVEYDDCCQYLHVRLDLKKGGEPFTYDINGNVSLTYPLGVYLTISLDWGNFPKQLYDKIAKSAKRAMITSSAVSYGRTSEYMFRLTDNLDILRLIKRKLGRVFDK